MVVTQRNAWFSSIFLIVPSFDFEWQPVRCDARHLCQILLNHFRPANIFPTLESELFVKKMPNSDTQCCLWYLVLLVLLHISGLLSGRVSGSPWRPKRNNFFLWVALNSATFVHIILPLIFECVLVDIQNVSCPRMLKDPSFLVDQELFSF